MCFFKAKVLSLTPKVIVSTLCLQPLAEKAIFPSEEEWKEGEGCPLLIGLATARMTWREDPVPQASAAQVLPVCRPEKIPVGCKEKKYKRFFGSIYGTLFIA